MKILNVEASVEQLPAVQAFVNGELESFGCSMRVQMQVELAVEEIFVNIASYAYNPEVGKATVRCAVEEDPLRVVIEFMDEGKPFDPLSRGDVDISPEGLQSRIGGLGILLVKESMDRVSYAYENGKNILSIEKHL